ncbi:MAG TPA: hypothetical protein VNA25_08240 [Phycisphaerae bacterium]|nr:hypothetical protein [Phycisphaerae bacterium]
MNRWLASRWLVLSILAMGAGFYLAVTKDSVEAIKVFGEICMVALGGGHLTNALRDNRGEARNPGLEDNP